MLWSPFRWLLCEVLILITSSKGLVLYGPVLFVFSSQTFYFLQVEEVQRELDFASSEVYMKIWMIETNILWCGLISRIEREESSSNRFFCCYENNGSQRRRYDQ